MKLKEKPLYRKILRKGIAVDFCLDKVKLPNGRTAFREYLGHPGAVTAIPFIEKNKVLLVKQHRYPIQRVTFEFPGGKLSKDETPLKCIRREIEEETGYRAKKIKKLLSFYPCSAFSTEILHIYIATDLVKTNKKPDYDEFIKTVIIDFDKLLFLIKKGRIKDAKTIIGALFYKFLRR